MKIAYLGPAGTFTEDALAQAGFRRGHDALLKRTIADAIRAVDRQEADRAFVPIENSLEGSVRPTLDALASIDRVTIVGERDYRVRVHLIGRQDLALGEIEAVYSHPQALAQCQQFLTERLPEARLEATSSTAEAVRSVSETTARVAALGAKPAIDLYGCKLLAEGIQDEEDNITRFVWVAPAGTKPAGCGRWKTTIVFSELGADRPGALMEALAEFADRGVNLSRIESRPLRQGFGSYRFFCDLDGGATEPAVATALGELRNKVGSLRVLGSYPRARKAD